MERGVGCLVVLIIFVLMALAMWDNPDGETNVTIDGPTCGNCEYILIGGD